MNGSVVCLYFLSRPFFIIVYCMLLVCIKIIVWKNKTWKISNVMSSTVYAIMFERWTTFFPEICQVRWIRWALESQLSDRPDGQKMRTKLKSKINNWALWPQWFKQNKNNRKQTCIKTKTAENNNPLDSPMGWISTGY